MIQIEGLPPEVLGFREVVATEVPAVRQERSRRWVSHGGLRPGVGGQQLVDKYDERRTYTDLARLVAMVCGESSAIEFAKRLMFSAIVGNGDMHLKNWSLLYPDRRTPELSPAYDLLCTTVYIRTTTWRCVSDRPNAGRV